MKQNITILFSLLFYVGLNAQCDDLFISEYVHAGWNNRAAEIYNPTSEAIDLSGYMFGRFSNGDANASEFEGIELPAVMLQPHDVFVAVIDKRDENGSCLEEPLWDGFIELEPRLDSLDVEITDSEGNVVYGPKFAEKVCADGTTQLAVVRGTTYHNEYDLQGRADGYFTPVYTVNNAMYWNGNDAVALVKGTSIEDDLSNVIDVVGVIGEDPGTDTGWTNEDGFGMTADRTLIRAATVESGSVQLASAGDTFNYADWWRKSKYSFIYLGSHDSACGWSTGVTSISGNANVQLYPNPTNGENLNIEADAAIESISLQTIDGRVVEQYQYDSQETQVRINLQGFTPGFYFAKINLENGNQVAGKVLVK